MSTVGTVIRRELRVAFSARAQPVWIRIVKWTCILVGVVLFRSRPWFWWTLAGLTAAGILVHFLYRSKTKTWTRAWGGWDDLSAGRD